MKIRINGAGKDAGAIKKSIADILKENKADGELNITLISDQKMKSLNNKYRGKNKTTDVLSFEMNESV